MENGKKRVLGFDASTTTIGVSVVDYDDSKQILVHCDYFKPPKDGDIFVRLATVRAFVFEMLDKYKPDDVALEDIILFMKGKSSAKTVTGLAVLNRTVGLAIFNHFGKPPVLLNVLKIRHALKEDKALPAKEDMPELIAKRLGIDFPYRYVSRGKTKGKIAVESYDMADGIAVSLGFIETSKIKPKVVKKKKI